MRILLLGKNGQVGWELQRSLAVLGDLVALDRQGHSGLCGDLLRPDDLMRTVRQLRPQVIINAAAHTAVDLAQSEPELAHRLNAQAPAALAGAAKEVGALMVHYSTDYVFDGSGSAPWREDDTPAPLNVYGHTKLAGEQAIAASGCRHLILRTSWVYGARGGNFARTMLRLAQERDSLAVIDDQVGAPTAADLIADVTALAIRQILPPRGHHFLNFSGVYHLAAAGHTSWHGYALHVLQLAEQSGVKLKVSPSEVRPIPSAEYPTAAQRPLNSRLDTRKIQSAFGLTLPTWQSGVARMLAEIQGTTS